MSNVLRSTTFQLEFNGNDGITGVKTFTKAVRDADAVVEELTKQMGENATVTVKNVKTKQELTREARTTATQLARTQNQTARLTKEYTFLSSTVGKTADEIEVLTAVQRLGENASKSQQEQVANSVREFQRLRTAADQTQGSFRNSRGVMQNFGWQMQDTIVQLQMGTSAFTVLSQQGSQMAAAFGPGGAVIGAGIALAGVIGGTLFTSLQSATEQTKKLDAATADISKVLESTSVDVFKLTEELERLYEIDSQLAELRIKAALIDSSTQMKEAGKNIISSFDEIGVAWYNLTVNDLIDGGKGLDYLRNFTKEVTGLKESSKSFDDARFKVRGLLSSIEQLEKQGVNTASIDRFGDALANVSDVVSKNNDGFNSFVKNSLDLVVQFKNGEVSAKNLKTALDELDDRIKDRSTDNSNLVKAFEQEAERTKKQTETVQEEYNRRIKIIQDFHLSGEKSDKDATAAAIRLLQWRKTEEKKIRDADFKERWGSIDKAFTQEYNRTTKQTETIQQEYERRYEVIKAITAKPGHDAEKAAEAFTALEQWKTESLRNEYQKRERVRKQIESAQIQTGGRNDPVGAENATFIMNMRTLAEQAAQIDEDKFEEKKRINALIEGEVERHTTVMRDAEIQSVSNQIATFSMAAVAMSEMVDLVSTGAADVESQVADMNEFQKTMFLINRAVAAANAVVNGVAMGSTLAAAAATYDWTGASSIAWLELGTAMGVTQAAVIAGTTIAGAFDNGGYIPAGSVGAVAGYGDEFVNGTLIQGPANVTSRKDTAELLRDGAGSGKTSTNLSIQIENRIEGASYQVEQLSEDRVRIIAEQVFTRNIDSGVSNTLSNNNSKTAKSLLRNYSVGRNL